MPRMSRVPRSQSLGDGALRRGIGALLLCVSFFMAPHSSAAAQTDGQRCRAFLAETAQNWSPRRSFADPGPWSDRVSAVWRMVSRGADSAALGVTVERRYLQELDALAPDTTSVQLVTRVLAHDVGLSGEGERLDATFWVIESGGYEPTRFSVVLGDLTLSLYRRLRIAHALRRAEPTEELAVAMFRSSCQVALWSEAIPTTPGDLVHVLRSKLTEEGVFLLLATMRWVEVNLPRIAGWLGCGSLEECYGASSVSLQYYRRQVSP